MKKYVVFLFLTINLLAYELGSGYQIGTSQNYIGGYISTEFINELKQDKEILKVDDIAILGYGSYKKFSYLTELENVDFYTQEFKGFDNVSNNHTIFIERVYAKYDINEKYRLKAGKFSTPIGYWNLTPINVLRDTTSTPVLNYIIYPKHTSGLELTYENINTFDTKLNFIVQNSKDIDGRFNNIKVKKHYALGVEIDKDNISYKLNLGYFKPINRIDNQKDIFYGDFSFKYENDKYKLMAELAKQKSYHKDIVPYAFYLQSVYKFLPKQSFIYRFEKYKEFSKSDTISILGYTYRPKYPIALKVEYQSHSKSIDDKILASFSVLF